MADRKGTVAVLGASAERRKFGNKSLRAHQRAGYRVFPINPTSTEAEIEGAGVFPNLAAVPEKVDRVTIYLPPPLTLKVLDEVAAAAPAAVWLNPGTTDDAVRRRARELRLPAVEGCSIVDLGMSPADFPD